MSRRFNDPFPARFRTPEDADEFFKAIKERRNTSGIAVYPWDEGYEDCRYELEITLNE
jgi:hypothetical protein